MSDAEKVLSLMHKTPNGGYACKTGCTQEFDAIPCEAWSSEEDRTDYYEYGNGDLPDLILAIGWGGEEFFPVSKLPESAV